MVEQVFDVEVPERGSPCRLIYTFLSISGLWPPHSDFRRYLYHLYSTITLIVQTWLIVGEIGAVFLHWGDIDKVFLLIGMIIGAFCSVIKAIYFFFRFPEISQLLSSINTLMVKQKEKCENEEVLKCLKESQWYAEKICWALMAAAVVVSLIWDIVPLTRTFMEDTGELFFPVNIRLPYNSTAVHSYGTLYLLQVYGLMSCLEIILSMDLLIFTLTIFSTAQLKILCLNLSNLKTSNGKNQILSKTADGGVLESEIKYKQSHHYKEISPNDSYRTLSECIQHHQTIIRFVGNIESTMNGIVLPQFLTDLLLVCLTLFLSLESSSMHIIMTNFPLLMGVIFQLFLYCWHAQSLIDQSLQVAEAAYVGNWVETNQGFKKTMLILMIRSQKPLMLTYGKFSAISRRTFVNILNASYSYYAILRQINKHKE